MPPRRYGKKRKPYHKKHRRWKTPSYAFASGMPKVRRAILRYVDQDAVFNSSPTGLIQTYRFSTNGIYDPNITGTGHQPMGFDQWATYYNHYTVIGAKIRVRAIGKVEAGSTPTVLALYQADDTSQPYTSITGYLEAKKGPWITIDPNQDTTLHLSQKFSAKKFFNVADMKDNYDRLGAAINTNPSEQGYFTLVHSSCYPGQTSMPVNLLVTIDYIVEFSEPKDMEAS